jgi:thiol-disulfide isomerase/thioredoxin
MVRRSSLLAILFITSLSQAVRAAETDPLAGLAINGPSIILFWAAWCAPCRAEISAWPELQRAADPLPVHVVVLDTSVEKSTALLKALPANRVHNNRASSFSMLTAWADRASGLPFAVAIDASGHICASQNGGLTAERVVAMRRRCAM